MLPSKENNISIFFILKFFFQYFYLCYILFYGLFTLFLEYVAKENVISSKLLTINNEILFCKTIWKQSEKKDKHEWIFFVRKLSFLNR